MLHLTSVVIMKTIYLYNAYGKVKFWFKLMALTIKVMVTSLCDGFRSSSNEKILTFTIRKKVIIRNSVQLLNDLTILSITL